MPRTITLQDVEIVNWLVDVEKETVTVHYHILQDDGETFKSGYAVFWRNLPEPGLDENGEPLPLPDNWYQLPAKHLLPIAELTSDARTALLALIA